MLVYRDGEIGYRTIQGLPPILGTVLLVSENARQEFDFFAKHSPETRKKNPLRKRGGHRHADTATMTKKRCVRVNSGCESELGAS